MATRTFGWIQNPSSTDTLRDILGLFVPGSDFHKYMVEERLPLLASAGLFQTSSLYMEFQKILRSNKPIPYNILKGKGACGASRKEAKCSGLAQAAVTGQQFHLYSVGDETIRIKKPYTDDWTADGFLRWAVSLGFLDYSYSDDTCSITAAGVALVNAEDVKERNNILGQAFLSYPPVCRVMGLLCKYQHMTKFEIGAKLGFTDEAGFTSFPQNIWVQAYEEAADDSERKKLRTDTEGSSDKYARMICNWLEPIGWVRKRAKTVKETFGAKTYECVISSAFEITAAGIINYKKAVGLSKSKRLPKIVYRDMLASKAPNAKYLRMRRTLILEFLSKHQAKSLYEIVSWLSSQGIQEKVAVIKDDLTGFVNIGLDIVSDGERFKLLDNVTKLVAYKKSVAKGNADATVVKDRVRLRLHNINHKYLTLIDYAFSGKENCTEFEIYTIDLLVNELEFDGIHLGGSRRPDGLFDYNRHGVIIDNKAYSKGFTISRKMADEMTRYVQENNDRNPERNKNQWWLNFSSDVCQFNFVFISSVFKGEVKHMLNNIKQSTGVDGCVLTAENLLYFADAIKKGSVKRNDFINMFGGNDELVYPFKN